MTGVESVAGGIAAAVTALARAEGGRMVALLAHRFGDLDLADESVQDALVTAVQSWPAEGVPANPAGWLRTVATRKAIDRIRRQDSARRRTQAVARDLIPDPVAGPDNVAEPQEVPMTDDATVRDERLRLILLCCHPALNRDAQVALTPAAGRRADHRRDRGRVPAARADDRPTDRPGQTEDPRGRHPAVAAPCPDRAGGRRAGGALPDLQRGLPVPRRIGLVPDEPEVRGLLALQLFHRARTGSRFDALNHAVAVGMADGPEAGLALLERLDGLSGYHLEPAARAELLARAGRVDEAVQAFDEALRLVPGEVERRHLERRRGTLRPPGPRT